MDQNSSQPVPSESGKPRPKILRALGRTEPPSQVTVDGKQWALQQVFKHDSWAATAMYACCGERIVCKFNRLSPIGLIPMRWLGRFLAKREHWFLTKLADLPGIPRVYPSVEVNGQRLRNAVAHDYVEGQPLSLSSGVGAEFFVSVDRLLTELHQRRICYVDLHKQENIIVGDDGLPYLIDFQVSLYVPNWAIFSPLFVALRESDLYHVSKHRVIHNLLSPDDLHPRPKWISAHRRIAVPLRTFRRKLLVAIGVRKGNGSPSTEIAPEVGLRRAA